ncbi:MAG: 2-amino-4-hydroxy-6-hydroxymethyldihydropteridine diphosphokinase [Armatimonadota bacterium]
MRTAYLSLGSNVGDRLANLREAVLRLNSEDGCWVVALSSIYETEPVGFKDQPDFLNMVVCINTLLDAVSLLSHCQSIENEMGRVRTVRWGPRVIDIDILLYENENIKIGELVLPHPKMLRRGFVMIPLAEIAPDVEVAPGLTAAMAVEHSAFRGVRYFGRLMDDADFSL